MHSPPRNPTLERHRKGREYSKERNASEQGHLRSSGLWEYALDEQSRGQFRERHCNDTKYSSNIDRLQL